jgi:hypothetical protein
MTRAAPAAVLPILLLAAACGRQASAPPSAQAPAPPGQAAPAPAASGTAPRPASARRFFVGRWATRQALCKDPWVITADGLTTPGEVSCRFLSLADTPEGVQAGASCTAEGPPRDWTIHFSYAQSAQALLVEGGPFRDTGLVACGPAPVEPRPPGTPGGLPDDRTPVSEAPFTPASAQGAANVVQTYFAELEGGHYDRAWRLLGPGGRIGWKDEAAFARAFKAYQSYHAQVGAPGPIEGAAGSLYVDVPVQVYGRRVSGEEAHDRGTATLRRVNDVPGSTPEQRSWRIFKLTVAPRPPGLR